MIDVTDPAAPQLIGSADPPPTVPGSTRSRAMGVAIQGDFAYVSFDAYNVDAGGLQIVDIGNPATPTTRGIYYAPKAPTQNLSVAGEYAFLSDNEAGLLVIDVSAPGSPALAGSFAQTGLSPTDVDVAGELLYVANGYGGNRGVGSLWILRMTPSYNFTGFYPPVNNLPMLNPVKAGRAVPVKFSLNADKGLDIFASGYPKSQAINCDNGAPSGAVEETVTAGGSGLSYDAVSDQYTYVWKTDQAWAGYCRQLIVRLKDDSDHKANFRLR